MLIWMWYGSRSQPPFLAWAMGSVKTLDSANASANKTLSRERWGGVGGKWAVVELL